MAIKISFDYSMDKGVDFFKDPKRRKGENDQN
jgi:hypothetical protein